MNILAVVVLAAAAATVSSAQNTSTTILNDYGIITNVPISGDYNGALRPQVHFSPPSKFMNDPCGCFIDFENTWHLYYQYNPTGTFAGNQHWGHATSKDLYHWTNQKIALFATPDTQIYSGSIVVDVNNTSGFFPNQTNGVVAIYTLNSEAEQVQDISYSYDNGFTFIPYAENPVLKAEFTSNQFRDPKVIWYQDHWVMVIAYAQEFVVGIFTSPNLKDWSHASNFTRRGLLGLQYECPNLVEIQVAGSTETLYLMTLSLNPGAPLGGSITQYFPGSFNGTHFVPVDNAARIADFGKDNYAGQFFDGLPRSADAVSIAWASNWQYAQSVPTGELEGWRSSMSLPRRNYLANVTRTGWDLISIPYDLTPVRDTQLVDRADLGNSSLFLDYTSVSSGALYFRLGVSGLPSKKVQGTLNFTFSSSTTQEAVSGGFLFSGDSTFWLSRQKVLGFGDTNPFFTDKFSVGNPLSKEGTFSIEGVIDRSILEVFLDEGRNSASTTFFPQGVFDSMEVRASDLNSGVKVDVAVWGLKSAWATMASPEDGVVYGNTTTLANATQIMRYS